MGGGLLRRVLKRLFKGVTTKHGGGSRLHVPGHQCMGLPGVVELMEVWDGEVHGLQPQASCFPLSHWLPATGNGLLHLKTNMKFSH